MFVLFVTRINTMLTDMLVLFIYLISMTFFVLHNTQNAITTLGGVKKKGEKKVRLKMQMSESLLSEQEQQTWQWRIIYSY